MIGIFLSQRFWLRFPRKILQHGQLRSTESPSTSNAFSIGDLSNFRSPDVGIMQDSMENADRWVHLIIAVMEGKEMNCKRY